MAKHNHNASAVVDWLQRQPQVSRVYYPGLPLDPQLALFRRQMKHAGGLLSFELAGERRPRRVSSMD
ncbi:MAG: PLP-dependent transferase [Opitutus sp.]